VSGDHIRPILIPIGAVGITVFFTLLGLVPATFLSVAILIAGAGFFAGFYIIPLQAMLQKFSPDAERGRFLGTANAVSFGFLALASLIYVVIRPLPIFKDDPDRIFLVSAGLMAVGAAYFMVRLWPMFKDLNAEPAPETP
jgi:acyl-[acyl-carrier-protein]-phospholipid O-acyltransferase/long-chain-fatty-acid--[acyl-carrier-protein] ligase